MEHRFKKRFLLRFDDICPTMQWDKWSEIERALIDHGIKPVLAVVPDNRDPVLQVNPPVNRFWDRARYWQQLGWTIALHGFQHLYVTRHGGLVTTRKKSEFVSLPPTEQEEKLRRGIEIFEREGIKSRVWIAPGNAFDATTVSLLPRFGIDVISAGWFWGPFVGPHETTWLPCQLSIMRPVPAGFWTVCYHHNSWTWTELSDFQRDLEQYQNQIASLPEVLEECPISRAKWCYHFCTSPRLSSFVLRVHLKLCKMFRRHTRQYQGSGETPKRWSPQSSVIRSQ